MFLVNEVQPLPPSKSDVKTIQQLKDTSKDVPQAKVEDTKSNRQRRQSAKQQKSSAPPEEPQLTSIASKTSVEPQDQNLVDENSSQSVEANACPNCGKTYAPRAVRFLKDHIAKCKVLATKKATSTKLEVEKIQIEPIRAPSESEKTVEPIRDPSESDDVDGDKKSLGKSLPPTRERRHSSTKKDIAEIGQPHNPVLESKDVDLSK